MNKLLIPLAVLAVAAMAVIVLPSGDDPQPVTKRPAATHDDAGNGGDADLPSDTLKTLSAQVADFNQRMERMSSQIHKRDQKIEEQSRTIADLQANQGSRREPPSQPEPESEPAITTPVDQLAVGFEEAKKKIAAPYEDPDFLGINDIDVDLPIGGSQPIGTGPTTAYQPTGKYRRHYPVGHQATEGSNDSSNRTAKTISAVTTQRRSTKPKPVPVFTVPPGSTLLNAVTFTALIGRVPKQNDIADPMPFKVLIGADNLAANGMRIPGLQGMVMTGVAYGDSTFSCARGAVRSALFVFSDGRIVTATGADATDPAEGVSSGQLAWLSDERGNPCIPGKHVTNAPEAISTGILSTSAAAGLRAWSEQQTTTTDNTAGGSSSSVTGNTGAFVLGRAAAAGGDELARVLAQRQSEQWDAIYVNAGTRVAVHVERPIELDKAHSDRRVFYAAGVERRTKLD